MNEKDRGRSRRRIGSKRVRRALRPMKLGAGTAAGRAATALRSIGADAETKERRLHEFHSRTAERYARELGDMKGALMKMGQLLSFIDVGAVPDRYRDLYTRSLGALLADAPPMDAELIDEVVRSELGSPAKEVFAWFSPTPIAAASIGQVHEARLKDGTKVAVKVQYPGVAEAIDADLSNTELLATFYRLAQSMMGGLAPKADPRIIVGELRDRISEELDYRREAENQQFFHDLYAGHPAIRVPPVYSELSTDRVLTMAYVDGRRWDQALHADPDLRLRWAEVIYRFALGSLDRFSVFNADPHPGNYMFHDDGTVSFLDFGCVKHVPLDRQSINIGLIRAAAEDRADDLRALLVTSGFLPADDDCDPQRLLTWLADASPYLRSGPYEFTHEDVRTFIRRMYDPLGEFGDVVRRMHAPKDFVMLTRIDVGLWSVLASLGGAFEWRALADEIWGTAAPCSALGIAEAAWLGEMRRRSDWPPVHRERPSRFATPVPLDFDPLEADFTDDPYGYYARLRTQGRIHWMPPGLWMVTRYDDCVALLRDERLSSDPTKADIYDALVPPGWGSGSAVDRMLRRLMVFMDPPDHTRLRTLVSAAFSRRSVEELRPRIESITTELLDELDGPFDVVTDFAYPLPITVIAELLGVPTADRERFGTWSRELVQIVSVDAPDDQVVAKGNATVEAFMEYFRALVADRRGTTQDDLLSALIEAEEQGNRLSEDELLATCVLLLVAGHETTANLIVNGLLALLNQPDALERLRTDPSISTSGIEELLRYDSPVQATARTTVEEMEVAGKPLGPGERVVLLLGSANRDRATFDEPDVLRLDRSPNHHLAFGGGIHFCLGAPLARLEARIALPMLLQRFPGLKRVDERVEYRPTFPIRAPAALRVSAR